MKEKRFELQPSFILHKLPYRNTSFIVKIFTLNYGLITIIAKGVRRAKSQRFGWLQPFIPVLVSASGRGDLKTLVNIEPNGYSSPLMGESLYCGFYLNELLLKLLAEQDEQATLFHTYSKTLIALNDKEKIAASLRQFEKALLQELGYGLDFLKETREGRPIVEDETYHFIPEHGFIHNKVNSHGTGYKGRVLQQIAQNNFDDKEVLLCAKQLFAQALTQLQRKPGPLESKKLITAHYQTKQALPLPEEA